MLFYLIRENSSSLQNILMSLQHCGSKNTVTVAVTGTGLLSGSFLLRSTDAKALSLVFVLN